jgi:hypothetical protein
MLPFQHQLVPGWWTSNNAGLMAVLECFAAGNLYPAFGNILSPWYSEASAPLCGLDAYK